MLKKYPLLYLVLLAAVCAALYMVFPVEFERDVLAPRGEGDRTLFGEKVVVMQEFKPHAGISGIDVPVGSFEYPSSPLLLHIRDRIEGEDIVVTPLFSFDEEVAKFRFSPIWKTPDQMVWILEAPHAVKNSLWVYREVDESAFLEGKSRQGTRILKGNFGFTERWKYPRIMSLGLFSETSVLSSVERQSVYAGSIALLLFAFLKRFRLRESYIVWACIAIGAILHIHMGIATPVIIDEGAYIQDVLQTSGSLFPFRDFLTKGPLYLFVLWLWSFIVPNTIIAWRLFAMVSWATGGFVFWKLTEQFGLDKRARLLAVAAFNVAPAAVALTTPLLLQTTSVTVSLIGLLVAHIAIQKSSVKFVALSASIFTAAFLMRVTSAIPALIALVLILFIAKPGLRMKLSAIFVSTGLALIVAVFFVAAMLIGIPKAAVMVNMEAFLISQNRMEIIASSQERESIVRTITIESRLLWRAGVLLLAPIFIAPLVFVSRHKLIASSMILMFLLFFGQNVLLHLRDTGFLLPGSYPAMQLLIVFLCFVVPFITAIAALLHEPQESWNKHRILWRYFLVVLLWLGLTAFAYSKWGRFRQSYLTEFLPQLALLFGIGFHYLTDVWQSIKPAWFSRILVTLLIFCVGASWYQGYMMALKYPHTGTISQQSLVKIVNVLQKNVPQHESVFTAQPVATALSNRQILFGYSHPGWYREARFGTISEELRRLLFRDPQEITHYLDTKTNFILMESRTHEIYFDGYPERSEIVRKKFEEISSIKNEAAGDIYILYRRR